MPCATTSNRSWPGRQPLRLGSEGGCAGASPSGSPPYRAPHLEAARRPAASATELRGAGLSRRPPRTRPPRSGSRPRSGP
eukprot:6532886-Alexandrium_andersonii.AAC.1